MPLDALPPRAVHGNWVDKPYPKGQIQMMSKHSWPRLFTWCCMDMQVESWMIKQVLHYIGRPLQDCFHTPLGAYASQTAG